MSKPSPCHGISITSGLLPQHSDALRLVCPRDLALPWTSTVLPLTVVLVHVLEDLALFLVLVGQVLVLEGLVLVFVSLVIVLLLKGLILFLVSCV